MLEAIPLKYFPNVKYKDNLSKLILNSLKENQIMVNDFDIFVIAQTIVSKSEGAIKDLRKIRPSIFALEIAKQNNKDPRHIEIILQEAKNICKNRNGVLVTETKHGFVCANSGVDKSNVPGEEIVSLLPKDPDKSAREIKLQIEKEVGKNIAVLISDTHNRPFRLGAINVAIGCSGINPLKNYIGKKDLFGYELKSTVISIGDQLCSTAGLLMGEADEGLPVIIIRGYKFEREDVSAKSLIRIEEKDYFR